MKLHWRAPRYPSTFGFSTGIISSRIGGRLKAQHVIYEAPVVGWYGISGGKAGNLWFIGIQWVGEQTRRDQSLSTQELKELDALPREPANGGERAEKDDA